MNHRLHSLRSRSSVFAPRVPSLLAVAALSAALAAQDPTPVQAAPVQAAPKAEAKAHEHGAHAHHGHGEGKPWYETLDVYLNILGAVGTSTERDDVLEQLQGGGHDPRKRGFTLQQAELGISASFSDAMRAYTAMVLYVDPYEGETVVELEEAQFLSDLAGKDLELKAGYYGTEFGSLNKLHPHDWEFLDQPVINTRILGPDGMRGTGARLAWRVPGAEGLRLLGGAQDANGETMASFDGNEEFYDERPIGGRLYEPGDVRTLGDLAWTARAEWATEVATRTTLDLGASLGFGPNATGGGANTTIYGADFRVRWSGEGDAHDAKFVALEGEAMARSFEADEQETEFGDPATPVTLPEDTLHDWGWYLQALYGFAPHWAAGLRGDWAMAAGDSYLGDGAFGLSDDPFRGDRFRLSPMLSYRPTDSTRVRLQYNYDDASQLDGGAHSVWLGFEVMLGRHTHAHR